jgi:CheY-like chemotaxis protein
MLSQCARRGNVVVVDDDAETRMTLSEILGDEGYSVTTASNGREALALIPHVPPPRVALVDLLMPEMDGWELVRAMEQEPSLKMPIIVISGMTGLPAVGANIVVEKPFDLDSLLRLIRGYCDGSDGHGDRAP